MTPDPATIAACIVADYPIQMPESWIADLTNRIAREIAEYAAARVKEARADRDALFFAESYKIAAERDGLLGLMVRKSQFTDGFFVTLPYLKGGYAGGSYYNDTHGGVVYKFTTKEAAIAAVLQAVKERT